MGERHQDESDVVHGNRAENRVVARLSRVSGAGSAGQRMRRDKKRWVVQTMGKVSQEEGFIKVTLRMVHVQMEGWKAGKPH
jgi:hypothetical protein